jgi:iron complex transport system substrate-binding protein
MRIMRNKWLNILLAGVLLLCACQAPEVQTPTPAPAETPAATAEPAAAPALAALTDMLGREFTLKGTPQRVVSLSPASTEILFALEKGGAVVGVDEGSDYPADAQSLPKLQAADVDGIAALSPDVVFVSQAMGEDSIKALEEKGLCVVCAEAAAYGDLYASIALTAQVMDADAAPLVQSIQEAVRDVGAQAAELDLQPTVYLALSYGENGHVSAGPGSFAYSVLQMAGGAPVTAQATQAYPVYTTEELLALAPQVVLVPSTIDLDELCAADGYKDLAAVQEGRVYSVDLSLVSRPGPRVAEGMQEVYEALEMSLNS